MSRYSEGDYTISASPVTGRLHVELDVSDQGIGRTLCGRETSPIWDRRDQSSVHELHESTSGCVICGVSSWRLLE